MNNGFKNFLKVFFAALSRPTRIVVLGISILFSLLFPSTLFLMIPLGLITVIAMSWTDVNNPDFMKKVLQDSSDSSTSSGKDLNDLIILINEEKDKSDLREVRQDLENAKNTVQKIENLISGMDKEEYANVVFVKDYIVKVVEKLIRLSKQEKRVREYLNRENSEEIRKQIDKLELESTNSKDKVTKREYEKTIELKNDQLKLMSNMVQRLERIDSYIGRIQSVLENTYANLTRVSLKEDDYQYDDSDILSESLKQIVDDIDLFESKSIGIDEKIMQNQQEISAQDEKVHV